MIRNVSFKSLAITGLAVCMTLLIIPSDSAEAQRRFQPINRAGRWLGIGYSDGYHQRTPGPNTGYYNPYSAHNSYLLSKDPAYIQEYGDPGNYGNSFNPRSMGYYLQNGGRTRGGTTPYSVYSPTNGRGIGSYDEMYRGQTLESQFEEDNPANGEDDPESILGFESDEPAKEKAADPVDGSSTRIRRPYDNDFQPATSAFKMQAEEPPKPSSTFEPKHPNEEIDEHKFDAFKTETPIEGSDDFGSEFESLESAFEADLDIGEIDEEVLEEIK